ncbi:MAG TPA: SufD family Fe-S cluster assembly protein [Candidatus Atribacteria bacterium]|nr:SufD family Fe-S cluster assembly protein [Candidatus Atribacteria bacterium]
MKVREDYLREIKERAEKALHKKAPLGPDVDLSEFYLCSPQEEVDNVESISASLREAALYAGVELGEDKGSATYLQVDRSAVYQKIQDAFQGKLEIMAVSEALERYPELWEYWWGLIPVDADKYTAFSEVCPMEGYFIRVFAHQKIEVPLQACLLLSEESRIQSVHNLVILEEGAEANLITGCASVRGNESGVHIGVSEFYLGDNSRLTFTMIHNWGENFHVRPRTVVKMGNNSFYSNTYVLLKPLSSLQTFPQAVMEGENADANFQSIVFAKGNSYIDIGSSLLLKEKGCRGNSVSRVCAADSSQVYTRGKLISYHDEAQAHLECKGILFSREAEIISIPELEVHGAPGSRLSHEAAVGPIEEEAVNYLRSRGLSREEALSLITRGFLNIDIPGIPAALKQYIDEVIRLTSRDVM